MQRALTVKRKHGEGMNAVFRVENRVYREFQMGRCAARLSVQHENAAALRAAVVGGPLADHDKVSEMKGIKVIGHITKPELGNYLVGRDGGEVELKAQGWNSLN